MRADNSRHIIAAARQRAEQTRQRAIAALRHMDAAGQPISFDAVARKAGVARSWLYTQDDLRSEIERLRQQLPPPGPPRERQRASDLAAAPAGSGHRLASAVWRPTTSSSATLSPARSASAGLREFLGKPTAATRRTENPGDHLTAPGQHPQLASGTLSSSYPRRSRP